MSAFLCSPEHFQKIADTMAAHAVNTSMDSLSWNVQRFLADVTGKNTREMSWGQMDLLIIAVVNNLYNLNQFALLGRYGDDYTPGRVVTAVNPAKGLTVLEFYKALSCLSYQCAEDKADATDLYKHLEMFEASVAKHIVNRLPEYDKIAWSI